VLILLVLLAVIFMVRRRAQLRQKLAMDVSGGGGVSGMMKKKPVEDEESLIRPDKSSQQFSWFSFLPFIRRSDRCHAAKSSAENVSASQDYQELCRQRMQSKTSTGSGSSSKKQHQLNGASASPLSSTICTNASETPGLVTPSIMTNSSAINSTPIRVTGSSGSDGKSDSNRSSTSSW
jgi:hypothetical protein